MTRRFSEEQVYVITMISPAGQLSTLFLMDICEVVAKYDGNIETINCLSQGVCAIGTSLKVPFITPVPCADLDALHILFNVSFFSLFSLIISDRNPLRATVSSVTSSLFDSAEQI